MASAPVDPFMKQVTGPNTRGLLRLIILCTIAAAAVSSRLFSVIRFESIIHECMYPGEEAMVEWTGRDNWLIG
jgi:dolichyl-diphosphooligosaccharide--protein glycosyltransferase